MNKEQAQQFIQVTFETTFDKGRFSGFVRNLLNHIEDAPFTYRGNYIPEKFRQYIKTLERIGKYNDGEHTLDILIITLQKETSLERARTMQRNFIAWYLNGSRGGDMKDAALVVYVSPDQADWRFSLVKMDYKFEKTKTGKMKVKEEFTPARRWSFLVGVNEKSHTAKSRLVKILADDEHAPTLAELEEAFNIETVTKEFFLKYRELFLRTKEALDKVVKNDPKVKADFDAQGVDTVNFSKKLLGQIVFLYFLQKKGWFGVGRDDDWGTGSKHFLRELFEGRHGSYQNFFNDYLEPLFYEALRIDRSHDDDYYSRFNCKIPFLNGGLFDPIGNYDWVHTDIHLPDDLFSNSRKTKEGDIGDGILDVFDRYNFTVREDEPLEKEVAIDPELLGKAYEKFNAIRPDNFDEFAKALKSGKTGEENKFNKKFGVYYTPREIVHYMCKQSLIDYLATCAEGTKLEPTITRQDIEDLIEVGEMITEHEATALFKEQNIKNGIQESTEYTTLLSDGIRQNAKIIDDWLADITVCDPAVGSGAFPLGMMNEIVRVRNVLSVFLNNKKSSDYEFKRHCIEHSLYGVDIDPGAVEIAKLRLWLSLVVDEEDIKNIKPPPNLDYKIVCGNSLIGLPEYAQQVKGVEEIQELKANYFSETNPKNKCRLKKEIDNKIEKFLSTTKKNLGYLVNFDFRIYFSEVFNDNGGFDVVIANPPYIGESGHKDLFRKTKKGNLGCFYLGKMDYFYFFFHLSLNIAKLNGAIAFITTNYYLTATGAIKLRKDFNSRATILSLINFNELRIFESAQGQHNIITLLNKGSHNLSARTCITSRKGHATPDILRNILNWKDDKSEYFLISQSDLYDGEENYIRLNKSNVEVDNSLPNINTILDKVANQAILLSSVANINQGIVSGCDYVSGKNIEKLKDIKGIKKNDGIFVFNLNNPRDVEIINTFTRREQKLLRPFFKNSDIDRYWCRTEHKKLLLYLGKYQFDISEYPNIEIHLKRFKDILNDRREVKSGKINYHQLQWYRTENIFTHKKIVVPYRTTCNTFAFNNREWFCRSDCYVIIEKTNECDLKYILALLNSSLYFQWLYQRGKRKGEILELFQKPLSEIPIKMIPAKERKPLTDHVDKILSITKDEDYLGNTAKQAKVRDYEKEIDQMVYQLYGLTEKEIRIVEGEGK